MITGIQLPINNHPMLLLYVSLLIIVLLLLVLLHYYCLSLLFNLLLFSEFSFFIPASLYMEVSSPYV